MASDSNPGSDASSEVRETSTSYEPRTKTREEIQEILAEFRSGLKQLYGDRFLKLYVFGSYARGDARAGSDLDILVVLDDVDRPAEEIDRTSELTSRVSLAHDVTVSRAFVDEATFRAGDTRFLRSVEEDLVPA